MKSEISPQVSHESPIFTMPVFSKNESLLGIGKLRRNYTSPSLIKGTRKFISASKTGKLLPSCGCPHVLIADDDPFQEFYYEVLFQKSLKLKGLVSEKEKLNFDLYRSGESLLEKYLKVKCCDCDTHMMIIIDFNMGNEKLNGIETALSLRKHGYKGIIILRTSEEFSDLCKWYPNLPSLLENKAIDCVLEKNNHITTKKTVQDLLEKEVVKKPLRQ